MKNLILLAGLGNSQLYNNTYYHFINDNKTVYKVKHWYSTYALLKYLKEIENLIPDIIYIIYPDTPQGIQSFERGWNIQDESQNSVIIRDPIKEILQKLVLYDFDIKGVKVPNIEKEHDIWEFLNILTNELNQIENASVIIDITHGFRLFQSLLFSFIYYFENISTNILKKIYYAIYQGKDKHTRFIELDQLIMLQHEISQIKLLIKNLDVSAFEWAKGKVRALKRFIFSLQKIMLYINNGIISNNLLEKMNSFLEKELFKNIPKEIFEEYDKFYQNSFFQGIIPKIKLIKEKIFGKIPEKTKIWQRQLNLAELLLTRKMDFSTSLQLIRESFVSWLSEEVLNSNPLEMEDRKEAGKYFGRLIQAQISNEYSINENPLFPIVSKLAEERNNFAHVFTTKEKIQLIEKRSKNIIGYMTQIKENIQDIARLYKLDENKEFFKNIIPNLEILE